MGSNLRSQSVGATSIVVGLSAIVTVSQSARCVRRTIFDFSGGGSIFIQNSATDTVASGIDISDQTPIVFEGPATFYLSAAGATMTVRMIEEFSSGA